LHSWLVGARSSAVLGPATALPRSSTGRGTVQPMAQPGNVRPTTARGWPENERDRRAHPASGTGRTNRISRPAERRAQRVAEVRQVRRGRQRRQILLGLIGAILLLAIAGYFLREQYLVQNISVAVPEEGRGHIAADTALTFKHYPPSSGTHYPSAQRAGVYRQEVPEGYWVHSLEHGYIVVLVRCTTNCDEIYNQLDAIYKGLPSSKSGNVKFVVTPYSKPYSDGDSPLMLMTWDHEQRLDRVDRDTITQFYNKFVDKGPEDIP